MADLTQKVKYTVEVDLTQLNALQDALKAADTSAKALDTSLANMSKTITAGGLGKALRSMSGTFGAMGTNMAKIPFDATATGLGNLAGAATGAQSALAGAAKGNAAVAQASKTVQTEMSKQATKTKELGEATDRSFRFLKVFGTFQALRFTAQQVFQSIKEGAQQLDLDNILSRQFSNFREEIAKAQDLTAGTVGRGALTKSYALMSSFGIPMDQFAENMELVQKMAVRTGQSADFLTESFARGISRLSPLILDNLGIQVSLSEANEEYAVATGKAVSVMTKQDRIAALLNHTLGKLRDNTDGVSLSAGSAAGAANRLEAAFDDLMLAAKKLAGGLIQTVDRSLQGAASDAATFADVVEHKLGGSLDNVTYEGLVAYGKALSRAGGETADLIERWDELGGITAGTSLLGFLGFGFLGAGGDSTVVTRMDEVLADIEAVRTAMEGIRGKDLWGAGAADVVGMTEAFRGLTEAQVEAAVPFLARQDALERTKAITEEVIQAFQGLAEADKEALRAAGLESANQAWLRLLGNARKLAEEKDISYASALVHAQKEGAALKITLDHLINMAKMREKNRELNAIDAKFWEDTNAAIERQIRDREALNAIREGSTIAELRMRDIEIERSRITKNIADIEKRAAEENWSMTLRFMRMKQQGDLENLDRLRETWRLEVAKDAAILASYKDKTNQQIELDAKRLEAFLDAFRAIAEAGRADAALYSANLQIIADIEGRIAKIRAMKSERGGGGGGAADAMDFTKDVVDSKSYEDEWTIVKRFWKEAQSMKKGFPELFPSIGDTLFGGFTPEQWTRQETVLEDMERQFDVLAARFGEEYANLKLSKMFDVEDFRSTLATVRDEVDRLGEHMRNLRDVSSILHDVADGFKAFGGALREDMFGAGVIDQINQFATNMDKFTEALESNKSAYDLTLASIPIMRQFTNAFIKDRRAQAGIEAAMQAAAAFAAWAIPNPAKALAHTAAAMLYAGVAGGAIKLPSGKPRDTTPKEGRGSSGGEVRRPDIHIHLQGTLVQTEAERGVLAQHAIAEARRRGML